jgi:hypothetical protein
MHSNPKASGGLCVDIATLPKVLTEKPLSLRSGTTATTYRTSKGEEWWTKAQSVFFVFSTNRTLVSLRTTLNRNKQPPRIQFGYNVNKNVAKSGGHFGPVNIRPDTQLGLVVYPHT